MARRERIAGVNPDEIGRPTGAYRVEILDRHTGRVKERIDAANYISPIAVRAAKWYQAAAFHNGLRFAHLGEASPQWPHMNNTGFTEANRIGTQDLSVPPFLPVESIVGTDSTAAESATDEWGRGMIIGYANRWKSGIPSSGPRGQINESQSELTADSVKIVFDFNEDQGNGTIESLMIGRVSHDLDNGHPRLVLPVGAGDGGESKRFFLADHWGTTRNYSTLCLVTGTDVHFYGSNYWNTMALADVTVDAFGRSVYSGTPTETLLTSPPSYTTGSSAGATWWNRDRAGCGAIDGSGNKILVYPDGPGNINVGSWSADGTTNNFKVQAISSGYGAENNTTVPAGAVVIGTKLYIGVKTNIPETVFPADTAINTKIHRFDLATQMVDATFTLGTIGGEAITFNEYQDISTHHLTTDGTDLFVHTSAGIVRYSTAGAILDVLGSPGYADLTETGVAPWSITTNEEGLYYANHARDHVSRAWGGRSDRANGSNTPVGDPDSTEMNSQVRGICIIGGKLFAIGSGWFLSSAPYATLFPIRSSTIFSRSLLDTAVVKTSSSTMKWTYELTLPSEWREISPHVAIPAAP